MKSNKEHKQYEFSGGVVRRDKAIYVNRELDDILTDGLRDDNFYYVTGSRQSGKTSMAFNVQDEFVRKGGKVVFFDFRDKPGLPPIEVPNGTEGGWWFKSLMTAITDELNMPSDELAKWVALKEVKVRSYAGILVDFFNEFVRRLCKDRLLLVFDELDMLGKLGHYTNDFFYALQRLHDMRGELQLSVLSMSVAHPAMLQKNTHFSDFKTGTVVRMPDFDKKSVKDWILGLDVKNEESRIEIGDMILDETGGQPYLTSWLFNAVNVGKCHSSKGVSIIVDELTENALNPMSGLSHFAAPKDFIKDRKIFAYPVLELYRRIINDDSGVPVINIEPIILNILFTTGLIKVDRGMVQVRNSIYKRIFNETWCRQVELGLDISDVPVSVYSTTETKNISRSHVCLINFGGTIGMIERDNKMVPPNNESEFLRNYPELRNIAKISFFQFTPKDGANIFPEDWQQLARAIYDKRHDGYDGVVVAHGTDTLPYTASAIAYALGKDLNFPVVFVGSQAPHSVKHGDAFVNLARACKIATLNIPEVMIVFGDAAYRAVRSEKFSDYDFRGFHSPSYKPLATISEQIEIHHDTILKKDESSRMTSLINEFETNVLHISQSPGLHANWYIHLLKNEKENERIKGIIIESLGLGNLPTLEGDYNMLEIIKLANQMNIPTVITSRYPISPEFVSKYLPATAPLQLGAISAGNMTSAAAKTKLMWLLPQVEFLIKNNQLHEKNRIKQIEDWMIKNYVGEVDKIANLKK